MQTHDVRPASSELQDALTAASDQDGNVTLKRLRPGFSSVHGVVRAFERHWTPRKRLIEYLQRLLESVDTYARRHSFEADRAVVGVAPPGAQPEFESAIRQHVSGDDLSGEQ